MDPDTELTMEQRVACLRYEKEEDMRTLTREFGHLRHANGEEGRTLWFRSLDASIDRAYAACLQSARNALPEIESKNETSSAQHVALSIVTDLDWELRTAGLESASRPSVSRKLISDLRRAPGRPWCPVFTDVVTALFGRYEQYEAFLVILTTVLQIGGKQPSHRHIIDLIQFAIQEVLECLTAEQIDEFVFDSKQLVRASLNWKALRLLNASRLASVMTNREVAYSLMFDSLSSQPLVSQIRLWRALVCFYHDVVSPSELKYVFVYPNEQ